ncbi:MAG: C40 family peptidase [Prevotella sp.]|jgi:cell wall-associated NlpC family hydrolase|nr:C40 family peptidase [Prevotella sp.]
MKKKVFLCALLILLASVDSAVGKVRKNAKKKIQKTTVVTTAPEQDDEIDNFDFLYSEGVDDINLEYDAIAVNSLMDEAISHIGARYRSGSKGPYTFDCSGFTSYVYRQIEGKEIGCSSRDQYARNIPVSRSEMQRGDLVFFTSPGSGRGVGHVGIVVDVDPITRTFNFIHASSKEGVKISNSNDGYYARRFIGVRRVL